MRIDDQRRSSNFEDRGSGRGGSGGGLPVQALFSLVRLLDFKGTLIAAAILGIGFFMLPAEVKQELLGGQEAGSTPGAGSVCDASQANTAACDFSRVVLASTEDVWTQKFERGALPTYGSAPPIDSRRSSCLPMASLPTGAAARRQTVGPFYCPADQKLYIDPGFYTVMDRRLRAPGDCAQT